MSLLNSMLEKITSVYTKLSGTNIYKLFQIISEEIKENNEVLEKIRLYKDIDSAEGEALDRICQNLNQNRNQDSDEKYRINLKLKVAINTCDGSINSIINIASFILNVEHGKIVIVEGSSLGEYAFIRMNAFETEVLEEADFSPEEFIKKLGSIIPVGVSIGYILFIEFDVESVGWQEQTESQIFQCPIPNEELVPSEDIFPC